MASPTGLPTLSPRDDALITAASDLRLVYPTLGIAKLLIQLKSLHPEWMVSEKRFRKVLQTAPIDEGSLKSQSETGLVAVTGIDPSVDVARLAPKVKVKMFGGEKGKGLVAKDKILMGDVLWQEEPWIVTADPSVLLVCTFGEDLVVLTNFRNMYQYLLSQRMCTQCLTMFNRQNPPLSVSCPHCDTAHFCNRLCLSRAATSASHHPFLCPGENPGSLDLLTFIHKQGSRHVDCVAKIIAQWRGEREWGGAGKAEEIERRVWSGMARVNAEDKEMERREW